ncbi:hypothetical protein [Acinetobacter gerneri]|uniref:Uncharacterized protein n=1 Tax=Acinetobacter gerneri DSM 14967 = CIP 107464 = MTCC 9824 TaxID=1120926 RepID=N8ZKM5_9GAMM|nr:hypothetical protein [Acinetobacter gerneri]ENV32313.1 hypothetical protein F960_03707 [Acinetobacter gerneri DSM 14967 = CIP 107464 = MTCC 9824]EPR85108.1 hypothetical protein L289_0565 [Acinetobacter gerneri DSM 14967 = CIP 107464 = MTCC 9824]
MKKIILMCSLFLSTTTFALDCDIPPHYIFIATKNTYPSSVFWLSGQSDSPVKNIQLKSAKDSNLLKIIPKNLLEPHILLQSDHPLKIGQSYAIKTPASSDIQIYARDFQTKIQNNPPKHLLKWVAMPHFLQTKFVRDTAFGAYGSVSFKLKTNWETNDYLINVKISKNANFSQYQTFLENPFTDQSGTTKIQVGFDLCSNANDFVFQPNQTFYAKFDLVTHDGKVLIWHQAPIKFTTR